MSAAFLITLREGLEIAWRAGNLTLAIDAQPVVRQANPADR